MVGWFSPGTPASSTIKFGRHDIAEILLKVAINNNNQIIKSSLGIDNFSRILLSCFDRLFLLISKTCKLQCSFCSSRINVNDNDNGVHTHMVFLFCVESSNICDTSMNNCRVENINRELSAQDASL
jgi:hypothetical protein